MDGTTLSASTVRGCRADVLAETAAELMPEGSVVSWRRTGHCAIHSVRPTSSFFPVGGMSSRGSYGTVGKVEETFDESLSEGADRLDRTWPGLLATGTVGGLDVGVGVFALFL